MAPPIPPTATVPLPPRPWQPEENRRYQYEIRSYGVLGGGSHIFISAEGLKAHEPKRPFCDSVAAVTYCLDTVKHTWSKVGEWELPFQGNVEYVPELKLWFGIPDEYAVRIAMDSKPVHSWNPELDNDTLNRDLEFDGTPNEYSELDADRLNEDLELDETPNKELQKLQKSEGRRPWLREVLHSKFLPHYAGYQDLVGCCRPLHHGLQAVSSARLGFGP
jgi:hypothetical protein